MPRKSRIAFPNLPHHIVQRGHSRRDVFFGDFDRTDYLNTLAECREALGIKIYGYCLMSNHVHLLVDPAADAGNISTLMKRLAGRHARRINLRNSWSGSIWESRFKCSPIETDRYLLTCGRYIDLNPVRAGVVHAPEDYAWSSYRARCGIATCEWLDLDPAIQALAETDSRRRARYREIAGDPIDDEDLSMIRGASTRNQLTGSTDFIEMVASTAGIHVPARSRGRPRKNTGRI
jgi:putative transposase